jgi:hypothetical protein
MRNIFVLSFASLAVVGCNQPPPVDDTPNQTGTQSANYVPGPYGYVQGSVIENITFEIKEDPAGPGGSATYDTIPFKKVTLADYHNDPTVKYVVMSGVAGWCSPCNDEQKQVPTLQSTYQPLGFRFLEAMIQGYNEKTGAPATETDVNRWATIHALHVGIGTDPGDKIHQYADIAAFPLNMVVRTSDMQIVHMQVGEESLDPVLSSLP